MTRLFSLIMVISAALGYLEYRRTHPYAQPTSTAPQVAGSVAAIGVLQSTPSLSAAQIDAILRGYGSPAAGSGADFYDLGVQYGIDPAYALAFFVHESSAGTDPNWDGMKPDGTTTHDIGNISCAGYATCYGRWRDYGTWREGINDWYRLISVEYIGRGLVTVDQVIPIYAPSIENDVGGYTNAVSALVGQWRGQPTKHLITPLIMIGAHFTSRDCGTWGFQAACQHWGTDYIGSQGDPVFAPFDVRVISLGEYGPGPTMGQYVQGVFSDGYVFYAGHLQHRPNFTVGQFIPAGTQIGEMNELSHTHIQLGPPGNVGPCAQDGACVDFEAYWEAH